jgi:hypothetical protein
MGVVSFNDIDNYRIASEWQYLSLKDDGDVAKVRFYIESMDDLKFYIVHEIIAKDGRRKYVNCLRTYDQPIDDCPFCKESLKNKDYNIKIKLFLPVLDMDDNTVKIFERGRSFKSELEGHIRRNTPLVNYPCEIERCGAKGSTDTTYKVYPLAQEKDETLIKDLPEQPELLGGYILELSIDEMEEFIKTGNLPAGQGSQQEELPRRTSRVEQTESEQPQRRRTASRF